MRLEQIDDLLQHECHINRERVTLVGVSGGPDSLCLVDVLHRLGYRLVVAHLDHRLRRESGQEVERVAVMAAERGLAFTSQATDVAAYARQHGLSIEEAARAVRYRFLFDQAQRWQAQAVAVGHTADDQVETVLMHFVRGAGLAGLKGMRMCGQSPEWGVALPLVRPLLRVWRAETLAYCQENDLRPLFDPSNEEPVYFRNRLRVEAIPYLEMFNPQFKPVVLRMAASLAGDWEVLDAVWQAAWQACLVGQGAGFRGFDRQRLLEQPLGVQRALVRRAASELQPNLRDFDFAAVERAVQFLVSPPASGRADLAGGIAIIHEGERVYLAGAEKDLPVDGAPQMASTRALWLEAPGCVDLGSGWKLSAAPAEKDEAPGWANTDELRMEAWLDANALHMPLEVRTRQVGDRFTPLGMEGGSQKLGDYMTNVKLPRRLRERWPLVCSAGEIVWVAGYRPAHHARVTETSQRLVHLRLHRL